MHTHKLTHMNLSTCSTQGDQAVLNELNLSEDLPSKASHTQIHIGDLESSSECSEDNDERTHVVEYVCVCVCVCVCVVCVMCVGGQYQ